MAWKAKQGRYLRRHFLWRAWRFARQRGIRSGFRGINRGEPGGRLVPGLFVWQGEVPGDSYLQEKICPIAK
jgi:hypothetical protein